MSTRIYFLIYYWWTNRNLLIKFIPRYYTTRHILCSCTFPLRPKNGSRIRNFCWNNPLIPPIYRSYSTSTMSKSSILLNIYWCKSNILPTTLLRIKRYTTTIFRLPRYTNKMKCCIILWGNSIICSTPCFHLLTLRSLCCTTTSNCNISHTIINRMKRHASTRIPQLRRNISNHLPIQKYITKR